MLGRLGRVTSTGEPGVDAVEVADVSVAMCTRNGAQFVAEQVQSILNQSIVPCEIVVGDDASSDNTIEVIEATYAAVLAQRAGVTTRLHVHRRPEPLGVTGNFEATISECRGSLVALCDQDDVWPPGRMSRLLPLFDDPAVGLVHTDALLVDADGASTGTLLLDAIEVGEAERRALAAGEAFDILLRRNLVTGATVIVRRDIAESAMPFPASWLHDEWLAAVASTTGSLRLVDEPWLHYRQHGTNEVGASVPTWSRRWEKLREPRGPRSARLVARASSLIDYLNRKTVDPRLHEAARAKLVHEKWRSHLPATRVLRLAPVVGALVSGRYRRFNRGLLDALRDLVQPV